MGRPANAPAVPCSVRGPHLHHLAAGALKRLHLVAQRQRQLRGLRVGCGAASEGVREMLALRRRKTRAWVGAGATLACSWREMSRRGKLQLRIVMGPAPGQHSSASPSRRRPLKRCGGPTLPARLGQVSACPSSPSPPPPPPPLTGEHALDGARGERLRQPELAHRHLALVRHVAHHQRRAHVPRAVRLHPAVQREAQALEVLRKVLDLGEGKVRMHAGTHMLWRRSGSGSGCVHVAQPSAPPCKAHTHHVGALGLPVHQHVHAQRLLDADGKANLRRHGLRWMMRDVNGAHKEGTPASSARWQLWARLWVAHLPATGPRSLACRYSGSLMRPWRYCSRARRTSACVTGVA